MPKTMEKSREKRIFRVSRKLFLISSPDFHMFVISNVYVTKPKFSFMNIEIHNIIR